MRNQVAFATGTGRCGTKFISEIFSDKPNVVTRHDPNPNNLAFHRYCKWYDLPVDNEGFLAIKKREILEDLQESAFTLHSSAHMALSLAELYQAFDAKIIILTRRPDKVVNSYFAKGYFEHEYHYKNSELALGFQDFDGHFHHYLGRTIPKGKEYADWLGLSRVGKIAWQWNRINHEIMQQLKEIPSSDYRVVKLEEFDFSRYKTLSEEFLGVEAALDAESFTNIASTKPNKFQNKVVPSVLDWNKAEVSEFESYVQPMADFFGYEFRIDRLRLL